ncbi:MAG TPA: hypothetical protein VFB96_14625, partial [Pirellulaceae bacterium]|nr:hypothetical protein [Pirellulaceae bacterium]
GYAQRPRRTDTPLDLAHDVEDFTSEVVEESLRAELAAHGNRCQQRSRELIGVTVPETLAIVDDLKRILSPSEQRKILKRAKSNEQRLAGAAVRQEATVELPTCPLLAASGCCLTDDSRPIQCRCGCSLCAVTAGATEEDADRPEGAAFAADVGAGVAEGLSDGLASAGWDGRRYELNSALARALELPDAAARWSRGESVFETCRGI